MMVLLSAALLVFRQDLPSLSLPSRDNNDVTHDVALEHKSPAVNSHGSQTAVHVTLVLLRPYSGIYKLNTQLTCFY